MKCPDYSRIEQRPFRRGISNREKPREPLGWIITASESGNVLEMTNGDGLRLSAPSPELMLNAMTKRETTTRLNVVFGLDFSAGLFFKKMKPEQVRKMLTTGEMDFEKKNIRYIPGKFVRIVHGHKTWNYYDISQFFPDMTLEDATSRYAPGEIPSASSVGTLCRFVQDSIERLNVHTNRLYSPAYIAQRLFLSQCDIPNMYRRKPKRFGYYAHHGGRIEVFRRGFIPRVRIFDIRSAYPAVMRNLVDVETGEWDMSRDLMSGSEYSFIKCSVRYDGPDGIIPFRGMSGTTYYPNGTWYDTYLTGDEFRAMEKTGARMAITEAWHFTPVCRSYPFRNEIDTLFRIRNEMRKDGNSRGEDFIKLLMNSITGKFIQINSGWAKAGWDDVEDYIEHDGERIMLKKRFTAGRMFNPVYYSLITSAVRLRLFRAAHDNNVVSYHTDGIITTGRIAEETGSGLGQFAEKKPGDAIVIGSGVYEIEYDDGSVNSIHRGLQKEGRGFIRRKLEENRDKARIPLTLIRPITLQEAYTHPQYSPSRVCEVVKEEREMSVCFDRKRIWKGSPRCADFLDTQMDSSILTISQGKFALLY